MIASVYNQLEQLIYEKTGLKIDKERRRDIEDIINAIQNDNNHKHPTNIIELLYMTPITDKLWQRLINRITIGETYFFRNPYHMHALRYSVLAEIIQRRRRSNFKYINIWSAGCSTGEEPYSVAILLHELLDDIEDWTITILATDVKQASLDAARQGVYRPISFRTETPDYIRYKYFLENKGSYHLNDTIRQMVTFDSLNLVTGDYPSFTTRTMNQDLILCRNVTIYFDEPTTQQVIYKFYEAISTEGWLVVGHSEPSIAQYQVFQTRNFENATLYQKPAPPIIQPTTITPSQPQAKKTLTKAPPVKDVQLEDINRAINSKDWDLAKDLLSLLRRQKPSEAMTYYLAGLIAMNQSELESAYQEMRRAIYCDANFFPAYFAMGEIYMQQNQPHKAQQNWDKANQLMLLSDGESSGD